MNPILRGILIAIGITAIKLLVCWNGITDP